MTKSLFLLSSMLVLGLSLTVVSGVNAQDAAPPVTTPVAEPPAQTLFQETSQSTPSAQKSSTSSLSNSAPSLSDFLAEANVPTGNPPAESPPELTATPTAPNPIDSLVADGADPNAPGLNLSVDGQEGGSFQSPAESAEEQKKKAATAMREEAFGSVTNQMLPLKPSEIRKILEMYDETSQAAETPVYPNPEPISSFQRISLDPGAKPLTVMTAMGNVTTISIVDITGQPWPIQDLTWAGDFQVEQPESGSQMVRITPLSNFAQGNVSMRLVGLNPPVILTLRTERKEVHVRLDVQIPEVGPKGVMPPIEAAVTTKAGDDFMTSILMGVVKGRTERLNVDGIDGRTSAFIRGDMMYIRTPYTMLSPAWNQSVQSADGMKVYALNYTPVVLLSDKGSMVRAYISHKETVNEQE